MRHFINLKDISSKDLRGLVDAKKRKKLRNKLSTLEVDKGAHLKERCWFKCLKKQAQNKNQFLFGYQAIRRRNIDSSFK